MSTTETRADRVVSLSVRSKLDAGSEHDALWRQCEMLRALVDHVPAMLAYWDASQRCRFANRAYEKWFGVSPDAMIGTTMAELLGPLYPLNLPYIEGALRGEPQQFDREIPDPAGGPPRYSQAHYVPDVAEGGVVRGFFVLVADVTERQRLEVALRRSELLYRTIVQNLPNAAIAIVDRTLRYEAAEGPAIEAVLRMIGAPSIVGRSVSEVSSNGSGAPLLQAYTEALAGKKHHLELSLRGRTFDLHAVPLADTTLPGVSHALAFFYDVTDRKAEAEQLRRAGDLLARERAMFQVTLANIQDGVALFDREHTIVVANDACAEMFSIDRQRLQGLSRDQFMAHAAPLVAVPATLIDGETAGDDVRIVELLRPRRRVLKRTTRPVQLADGHGFLVVWHDITAERELLAERERQLMTDGLTGIGSRRAAEMALAAELGRVQRGSSSMSIAMFDLDHFKRINDAHGHAVGDEVLRRVAAVLSREARVSDTVARWGGEEFLAVLPVPLDGARSFCERVRRGVEVLDVPGVGPITISAGIAEVTSRDSIGEAVERADACLYQAKRTGRNRVSSG
jgi:diguanylate cyclase (GGDEF)-like protein/PAS domain S-box-containing protein